MTFPTVMDPERFGASDPDVELKVALKAFVDGTVAGLQLVEVFQSELVVPVQVSTVKAAKAELCDKSSRTANVKTIMKTRPVDICAREDNDKSVR
jgi:hypothetical protein